jgi:anti-sigma regulatory factor (Ser/Thr protein kinase)
MRVVREVTDWLDRHGPARNLGADSVLNYTVGEIVNNAIDHSGAPEVDVRISLHGTRIELAITDAGIGAFENLRSRLHLDDHLHALQELSKGKTTTQPGQHTGEGIFFSSKMVDRFQMTANGLSWLIDNTLDDQTVGHSESLSGTRVELDIRAMSPTTPASIFERYSTGLDFDTTCCVIHLFEHGTTFISRSEAKRLVTNLDRFRKVILDFRGVRQVGQGFVDQVFRVWAHEHPQVVLIPEAMNREVEFMVRRGLAHAAQDLQGRGSR